MIEIGKTLISQDILEKKFVCDLSACKGACCIEGDAGAPVTEEEKAILDDIYEDVKPFMRPIGIKAVEEQGKYIKDPWDAETVTPLVNEKECAYVTFDDKGTALCSIEQAHKAGKIDFKKPISCHLYPVRITSYTAYDAVNYDQWDICSPACACGSELNVKVYKFLKESLTRKYGEEWYAQLEKVDELAENIKNKT